MSLCRLLLTPIGIVSRYDGTAPGDDSRNRKGKRVHAYVPMMHTGSGRVIYMPVSAMHATSLHNGHGHIHADFFGGESMSVEAVARECHHTHAPGCRLYNPEDESFLSALAVTLLESDLFSGLRESGALSGHDVPRQAQAGMHPASGPEATSSET